MTWRRLVILSAICAGIFRYVQVGLGLDALLDVFDPIPTNDLLLVADISDAVENTFDAPYYEDVGSAGSERPAPEQTGHEKAPDAAENSQPQAEASSQPEDAVVGDSAHDAPPPEDDAAHDAPPPEEDAGASESNAAHGVPGKCPRMAKEDPAWRQVRPDWMDMINKNMGETSITRCEKRGEALLFFLDLKAVKKLKGYAYEVGFPDYIVADESFGRWREKRSTLQLFLAQGGRVGKPLGPPHTKHKSISLEGNGAYCHWRLALSDGAAISKAKLRFSTPGNIPIEQLPGLIAVVFPMAPPMGWIEYLEGRKTKHQEVFRELYFRTFPTVGVEPHVITSPEEVRKGTTYFWRIGGDHEFEWDMQEGEVYEQQLPYKVADYYSKFEERGGVLFPPPATYQYYQNKVALAELFKQAKVLTPTTWIFHNANEALAAVGELKFPLIVKDPYGFSSKGIQQAMGPEDFETIIRAFFDDTKGKVEAIVQQKVVALKEARVTYIDGRPFHGYWRIRKSLESASAASSMGGYQSFDFPLRQVSEWVEKFARDTGIPVGGVDWIWPEGSDGVTSEPYTLEVSPTSDLNPPTPPDWKRTYKEFKLTGGYRPAFLSVRRLWTDLMALAVIDRYRRARHDLFVGIDGVVALSAARLRRRGASAAEVMADAPVADAAEAIRALRSRYFVRFLAARGSYEDAFNVTRTWLDTQGFEYDDLIIVSDAVAKVAHLTDESLLVEDFMVGHEAGEPREDSAFMEALLAAELQFVKFPAGGRWADITPLLA